MLNEKRTMLLKPVVSSFIGEAFGVMRRSRLPPEVVRVTRSWRGDAAPRV